MSRRPKKITVKCVHCGSPTSMTFATALGFDTEVILCSECRPKVKPPRVTLFGPPDGQEMGRWTDESHEKEGS